MSLHDMTQPSPSCLSPDDWNTHKHFIAHLPQDAVVEGLDESRMAHLLAVGEGKLDPFAGMEPARVITRKAA